MKLFSFSFNIYVCYSYYFIYIYINENENNFIRNILLNITYISFIIFHSIIIKFIFIKYFLRNIFHLHIITPASLSIVKLNEQIRNITLAIIRVIIGLAIIEQNI